MHVLTKYPWLVFGLGLAVGYYAHRHRKALIQAAIQGAIQGATAAQRQAVHLESILAMKHH